MTGLDTNVVIGWLLDDGTDLPGDPPYVLSLVVVAEVFWVLASILKRPKAELLEVADLLIAHPDIRLLRRDAVVAARKDWAEGPADFPDYLLMRDHQLAGATLTLTHDRKAARHPNFLRV